VDVDALAPGRPVIVDDTAFGWPVRSLKDIPAGDYWVQALVNRYETFHRSDGHVVKLPMDQGEGQHWESKPGNLYSKPVKLHLDPARGGEIAISMDQQIPPIAPQARHRAGEVHPAAERAPDDILGTTGGARCDRAPAGRMGHAPERTLSDRHPPRTFSGEHGERHLA
jgi:hypothetical protein